MAKAPDLIPDSSYLRPFRTLSKLASGLQDSLFDGTGVSVYVEPGFLIEEVQILHVRAKFPHFTETVVTAAVARDGTISWVSGYDGERHGGRPADAIEKAVGSDAHRLRMRALCALARFAR